MRPRTKKMIFIAPLAILGLIAFLAIGAEIVMLLWNWLLPSLFDWRQITFWQALGLLALCRILFGGFRSHGPRGIKWRRRMEERCDWMTPEEREQVREKFRQRMREKWGLGPTAGERGGQ
ncbi:MAG TPA: hypothetical protein VH437_12945 [Terriglobales bacterium]